MRPYAFVLFAMFADVCVEFDEGSTAEIAGPGGTAGCLCRGDSECDEGLECLASVHACVDECEYPGVCDPELVCVDERCGLERG